MFKHRCLYKCLILLCVILEFKVIGNDKRLKIRYTFNNRELIRAKKILKILLVIVIVILVLIVILVFKFFADAHKQAEDQANMVKPDEELIGEHFYIPREDKEPVDVNIYIPSNIDIGLVPVVFNIHGGAFIAGDADTLDTQSDRISNDWDMAVVTINYKLASGDYSIDYAVEEVVDTVKYFKEHCAEYGIDGNKVIIMGYSAGGYHAMASTLALKKEGIDISAQVLCYAYLRDTLEIYNVMSEEQKSSVAPTLFILAGNEPIGGGSLQYEEVLREHRVSTDVKVYDGALHGFIEENNPEYENLHSKASKSPEQEIMARDAENHIRDWLYGVLK